MSSNGWPEGSYYMYQPITGRYTYFYPNMQHPNVPGFTFPPGQPAGPQQPQQQQPQQQQQQPQQQQPQQQAQGCPYGHGAGLHVCTDHTLRYNGQVFTPPGQQPNGTGGAGQGPCNGWPN